ncbi:MAG: hypothetical protein ACLR5V_09665 [Collinsella aerofaciens]
MRDFITDAPRSSIPIYTLDEVFAKKTISPGRQRHRVRADGRLRLHPRVDTYHKIALPTEVENSMNTSTP